MDKLRIYNVKWTSYSAGPSNDNNRRTEIFLAGCRKAHEGNPCPGCFNTDLWDKDNYCALVTPEEAFNQIKKYAKNKYITFVGGEPLDQIQPLIDLTKLLYHAGYDVIIITHYKWINICNLDFVNCASIIVDGEYDSRFRIWDESKAGDGLHDVIGSGNQNIIDLKRYRNNQPYVIPSMTLESWTMDTNGDYQYVFSKKLGVSDG